jgi:hypothetical protein
MVHGFDNIGVCATDQQGSPHRAYGACHRNLTTDHCRADSVHSRAARSTRSFVPAGIDALGHQGALRLCQPVPGDGRFVRGDHERRRIIRITADNSPPSGVPGILVGFIEETEALRISSVSPDERHAAVVTDLVKYFGAHAADSLGSD